MYEIMLSFDVITDCLDVRMVENHGKYLGLPSMIGKSKQELHRLLLDKAAAKIQSWQRRNISQSGKCVLLKSVCQALPMHSMGIFYLPLYTIQSLEHLFANFWRGGSDKINWMSWKRLCLSRNKGGLNFRKLREWNLALLGKQVWRIVSNPNSLIGQFFKARYFPNNSFLEVNGKSNDSFLWRGFLETQNLIRNGLMWRIEMDLRSPYGMIVGYQMQKILKLNHRALRDMN